MIPTPAMEIPKIEIVNTEDVVVLKSKLEKLSPNMVDCLNWPQEYPSKPDVSFKVAHNGTHLFLYFFVEENEVLAKTAEDNGPVWTDSCVEFFISFGDSLQYYNAEFSCIGKALLGYRKDKNNAVHADTNIMNTIKRYSSLGTEPFEAKKGDFKWDMLLVIPVSAFWQTQIESFDGIKARGNIYKCGDNLTEPHYLSWSPIGVEKPNFHLPEYFGSFHFLK